MLSILIPTYNTAVVSLVRHLLAEAERLDLPIEIRCYDDCSHPDFKQKNKVLLEHPEVVYVELEQNLGRARIRNKLAEEAKYPCLLFLDGDVWPPNDRFLEAYLPYLEQEAVVYGGLCYTSTEPPRDRYLRWRYGQFRESRSAKERSLHGHLAFKTCNFLILKKDLLAIRFEESLNGYGHEDTLFALQLRQKNIPVVHIDNPVVHLGIDISADFLAKSEEAIVNLHGLLQNPTVANFIAQVKLIRYYHLVNRLYLAAPLRFGFSISRKLIYSQLLSSRPSLVLFDFYKLGLLLSLDKKD